MRNSHVSRVVTVAARLHVFCISASSPKLSPVYSVATTFSLLVAASQMDTLTLPLRIMKNSVPSSPCLKTETLGGTSSYVMTRHISSRFASGSVDTFFMRRSSSSRTSRSSFVRSSALRGSAGGGRAPRENSPGR